MLNELALVRNGLERLDSSPLQTIHKSLLGEPGKENLLRVVLNPQGSGEIIAGLNYLQGERNKKYWTQGDGQQNKFPAVKLSFPLRSGGVTAYQQWKRVNKNPSPAKHLECLADLREKHPLDFSGWQSWPKYRDKLAQRAEIYNSRLEGDARIVVDLLSIFLQGEKNGLALLEELDKKTWQQCERNADKDFLNLAALIMFASLGEKESLTQKGEMPDGKRPTLLIDYVNGSFYSAADKHWRPAISSALFASEAKDKQRMGTCALSGKNTALVADTFPAEKCDRLGEVKIYSRKKKIPTYSRYGKDAADAMPVSAHLADELASSLRYLNSKDKGTTWDLVPGETGTGDLLLSFCHALPDVPAARLLAYEPASLDDEEDYENETKEICNLFNGSDINLSPLVNFVIIKKVNDGVQKAIFSSSNSLQKLQASAESWCDANKNIPDIKLKRIKKGQEPYYQSPFAISPKQFAGLFKKPDIHAKEAKKSKIPGLPFAEAMTLFLNRNNSKEVAKRLLHRLLKQHSGLLELAALLELVTSKEKHYRNLPELAALKKIDPIKHHYDALCAISATGLLLHKLARSKEVYMNDLAYKLGQFCSALDEIHIGYCISVREGQLPNRLIGNQAYAVAVNNMRKALGIAAQRTAVYHAWAKKMSVKNDSDIGNKKIINAKYALIWLQKHSPELNERLKTEYSKQATAESKAELLLGYLAGRDFKKPSNKQQGEHKNAN